MSKDNTTYNPGIINTDMLATKENGIIKTEKTYPDGTKHITFYSKKEERRISLDEDAQGNKSNVHSSKRNSHKEYKGAR